MTFFSMTSMALSYVLYGIVITVVIMAIAYLILRLVNQEIVQTVPFYIIGVFLAVILIAQATLFVGAIDALEGIESVRQYLHQVLDQVQSNVEVNGNQLLLDTVKEKFPLISIFAGYVDFGSNEFSDISESFCLAMSDYLKSYIWKRVGWMLSMTIIACLLAVFFQKQNGATLGKKHVTRSRAHTSRSKYDDF